MMNDSRFVHRSNCLGVKCACNFVSFQSAAVGPALSPVAFDDGNLIYDCQDAFAGQISSGETAEERLCSAEKGEAKMAVSTCIKCSGHSFELALLTPLGDSRKFTIVQCSMCGTPVGVMDPATAPQIEALKNQIAAIDERLNRIAKALQD
jgi:hypothetical protein